MLPLRDSVVPVFHPLALVKDSINVVRDIARGKNVRPVRFQIFVDHDSILNGKATLCEWLGYGVAPTPTTTMSHEILRPLESDTSKERAKIIGTLADFPTESSCWREIDRQRLIEKINQPQIDDKLRFRHIAEFYLNSDGFQKLAPTTQYHAERLAVF